MSNTFNSILIDLTGKACYIFFLFQMPSSKTFARDVMNKFF